MIESFDKKQGPDSCLGQSVDTVDKKTIGIDLLNSLVFYQFDRVKEIANNKIDSISNYITNYGEFDSDYKKNDFFHDSDYLNMYTKCMIYTNPKIVEEFILFLDKNDMILNLQSETINLLICFSYENFFYEISIVLLKFLCEIKVFTKNGLIILISIAICYKNKGILFKNEKINLNFLDKESLIKIVDGYKSSLLTDELELNNNFFSDLNCMLKLLD